MKASAIIMLIGGLALLYGGLAWCIGIAWYHSKNMDKNAQKSELDSE